MATTSFLDHLKGRLGESARPNLTFFSYQVIARALAPVRRRLRTGKLNAAGESFVTGAAAYMAEVTERAWTTLGYSVERLGGDGARDLTLRAVAAGDTGEERYEQSLARDTEDLLLSPPRPFPWAHGRSVEIKSGAEPFPEQLYLSGVFFMESPRASTNRPRSPRFGGGDHQFKAVKSLLIDQLLEDCAIDGLDASLRELAGWAVFPPIGMSESRAQGQNMLAIASIVSRRRGGSREEALDLLRALLRSQAGHVRDLAARCLFIFGSPPRSDLEALHFHRAFTGAASGEALGFIARLRWQLESGEDGTVPSSEWIEALDKECHEWLGRHPSEPWRREPVFHDKAYLALAEMDDRDVRGALEALKEIEARHPGDWYVRTLLGSVLMKGPDPFEGERILREQSAAAPACPEAHYRLASLLVRQERAEEALPVYEECLVRWPWEHRASEACMELLTSGMVE